MPIPFRTMIKNRHMSPKAERQKMISNGEKYPEHILADIDIKVKRKPATRTQSDAEGISIVPIQNRRTIALFDAILGDLV